MLCHWLITLRTRVALGSELNTEKALLSLTSRVAPLAFYLKNMCRARIRAEHRECVVKSDLSCGGTGCYLKNACRARIRAEHREGVVKSDFSCRATGCLP